MRSVQSLDETANIPSGRAMENTVPAFSKDLQQLPSSLPHTCLASSTKWREQSQASVDCPSWTKLGGGHWAEGKDDGAVVAKLSEAAVASMGTHNGVAFDHGKTEALLHVGLDSRNACQASQRPPPPQQSRSKTIRFPSKKKRQDGSGSGWSLSSHSRDHHAIRLEGHRHRNTMVPSSQV